MAKWWKLGLGKGKDQGPKPTPRPEPTQEAPKKRGGLLGRLMKRGKKKETPAPESPETPKAPPAPGGPPATTEAPPEAPGEKGEGGPAGPGEKPERTYPSFLHVSADGDWIISDTVWSGVMSGTLHGADVKTFIDAMEAKGGPDYETAIPLVADAYGIPGGLINVAASTIHSVSY